MTDDYIESLDDKDKRWFEYLVKTKCTYEKAIDYIINNDLDCTTIYKDGSRPRQTINYGYRRSIGGIYYLLWLMESKITFKDNMDKFYIYKTNILNLLNEIHQKNIDFEKSNPICYYRKKSRTSKTTSTKLHITKDAFSDDQLSIGEHSTKVIKPKKETVAERKIKLANSKAISFAGLSFNPKKNEK